MRPAAAAQFLRQAAMLGDAVAGALGADGMDAHIPGGDLVGALDRVVILVAGGGGEADELGAAGGGVAERGRARLERRLGDGSGGGGGEEQRQAHRKLSA